MIELRKSEYKKVLQILEPDIEKCLYIYMNLLNYEKEQSDIAAYVDDEKKIKLIMVEYHNSFQVFEREKVSENIVSEVVDLIKEKKPWMVSGTLSFIDYLKKFLKEYIYESGGVFFENRYHNVNDNGIICEAKAGDAMEIAKLIALDSGLGGHYNLEDLANQFRQRIISGTGRSYVIWENGSIVGHTATYAQTDKYAVVSGTIIHPDYREKNYYMMLSNYILRKISEEGIKPYTFAVSEKMYKYHSKVHTLCATYARLKRKENEEEKWKKE